MSVSAPRIPYLAVHVPDGERVMLYRFFDFDGLLLYVGITDNPQVRWAAHARSSKWWPQVGVVHTEWLANRSEAEAAEMAAIHHEGPVHNVNHSLKGHIRKAPRQRIRSMYLHPLAREHFGDQPFTFRACSEQLGIPYGTVSLYGRRLTQQGAFKKIDETRVGQRGRAGLYIAVEVVSPSDASPVQAPLPTSIPRGLSI